MRRRREEGWVLMEAMVAMVVLSVAIVAINRSFAEAVLTRSIARDYTQARFFLEQVAGELEMKPFHEEGATGKGDFGEAHSRFSYTWSVSRQEVAAPSLPMGLPPQLENIVTNFEPPIQYIGKISVRVNWSRSGSEYSAELETAIAPGGLRITEDDELAPAI